MEQIITVIVTTLCAIITAIGGLIIAYLHAKTKQLEEKNKKKDEKINELHNGFRQDVFKAVVEVNKEVAELKTDMKLVKKLVVENKTHYKEIEDKSKK